MQSEEVNIVQVIHSVIDKVSLKAKEKGLKLENILPTEAIFIEGDEKRLEQILINLFENAIQYTEEGQISIHVEKQNAQKVLIHLTDSGIGIPKEEIPYIFDRFHRVEKSRSRDYGGTGLGLSIVKKLIDLQHGSIEVLSEVGEGTTFKIEFPLLEKE